MSTRGCTSGANGGENGPRAAGELSAHRAASNGAPRAPGATTPKPKARAHNTIVATLPSRDAVCQPLPITPTTDLPTPASTDQTPEPVRGGGTEWDPSEKRANPTGTTSPLTRSRVTLFAGDCTSYVVKWRLVLGV